MKNSVKNNDSKKLNNSNRKEKDVVNRRKKIMMVLKVLIVICILVLIFDVIFLFYVRNKAEASKEIFNSLNAYVYTGNNYYGVGSSNEKNDGYEHATVSKYDENYNKEWTRTFNSKYNSTFFNILEDGEDLLVVGSYEKTAEENEENLRTALFIKYDSDGKIIFKKTMQKLGNSKFVKVLVVDDGYIVVGQSIYPNNILGNEGTGGAIIIKYNRDGDIVWQDNTGGNKSGLFNDVIQDGDYLYVVGKDATRYGMFAKYTLDGEKIKAVSYGKTDTLGFSSIVKVDDKYICVGAKKVKEDDEYDHDTDGLIVSYNDELEKIDEVTYKDKKNGIERFNKIIVDNKSLIIIGHNAILDKENSTSTNNTYNYRSFILRYNTSLKIKSEQLYNKDIDDYFTDINLINDKYIVGGYARYTDTHSKELFLEYEKGF